MIFWSSETAGRVLYLFWLANGILLALFSFVAAPSPQLSGLHRRMETPDAHVVTLVNESASLPCNITPPFPGDQPLLVLWYRGGSRSPLYSYDERQRPDGGALFFQAGHHFSEDPMRMRFNPSGPVGYLTIRPVFFSDQGFYRCRVDYREARTTNFAVNLTVIVPPSKPIIRDSSSGLILNSTVGPFKEGESVTLTCEVHPGEPTAKVTWFRDGAAQRTKIQSLPNGWLRTEITLLNLRRHDAESRVKCAAKNNDLRPARYSEINLDMHLPPVEVKMIGLDTVITAGSKEEVKCTAYGSRPPAVIKWFIGGKEHSPGEVSQSSTKGNRTVSVLTRAFSKGDDALSLTCEVSSPFFPRNVIEVTKLLHVHYPPEVSLRLDGSRTDWKVGDRVSLNCEISSNPTSHRIQWMKDGQLVHPDDDLMIRLNSSAVALREIGKRDAGRYECIAENTVGIGRSKPVHINVLYAPECGLPYPPEYHVSLRERIQVSCPVDSNPPATKFRWQFNYSSNAFVDVPATQFTQEPGLSVLFFTPGSITDFGNFRCWAENDVGEQMQPCSFGVLHIEKPAPPKECSVKNRTSSTLLVACSMGEDGGRPQAFTLEVYSRSALLINQTEPKPRFFIKGLTPGTNYELVVYASNEKGDSRGTLIHQETSLVSAFGGIAALYEKLIIALWAIGGFGGTLVFLGMLYCLVFRARGRRGSASSSTSASASPSPKQQQKQQKKQSGKRSSANNGNSAHERAPCPGPPSKEDYDPMHFDRDQEEQETSPDVILRGMEEHLHQSSGHYYGALTERTAVTIRADYGVVVSGVNLQQQETRSTKTRVTQVPLMTSFVGPAGSFVHHTPTRTVLETAADLTSSTYSQVDLLEANPRPLSVSTLRSATLHHPKRSQVRNSSAFPFATIGRRAEALWIRDPSLMTQRSVGTECSLLEVELRPDVTSMPKRRPQLQRESSV